MNPKYTAPVVMSLFPVLHKRIVHYVFMVSGDYALFQWGGGFLTSENTHFCCHTMHMWNMPVLQQFYPGSNNSNIWMRAKCELQADNSSFVK